jgi:DNA polymerase
MRSSFLKEMGITEWVDRSSSVAPLSSAAAPQPKQQASPEPTANPSERAAEISGRWIFIGTKPQGDALTLFQNIVRVLDIQTLAVCVLVMHLH